MGHHHPCIAHRPTLRTKLRPRALSLLNSSPTNVPTRLCSPHRSSAGASVVTSHIDSDPVLNTKRRSFRVISVAREGRKRRRRGECRQGLRHGPARHSLRKPSVELPCDCALSPNNQHHDLACSSSQKSVPGPRLMYPAEPRTRPSINGLVRVAC